jgi:hypothetical protein
MLSQRLAKHRGYYRELLANPDKKRVSTSTKVISGGDYDIVLLEKCPCDSKEELHKRERYYIESIECVNKVIPGRSAAEWGKIYRKQNKEAIIDKKKIYYEENKEAYVEKNKIYREKNKEAIAEKGKTLVKCGCGSTHRHSDKARHLRSQKHQEWMNKIDE